MLSPRVWPSCWLADDVDIDGVHRDSLYPCWLHLEAQLVLENQLSWAVEAPEQLRAHWEMGSWQFGSLGLHRDLTPQPSALPSPSSDMGMERGQHHQAAGLCSGPASVPLGLLVVHMEVLPFQNLPGCGWASCQNERQVLGSHEQGAVGMTR